MISDSVWQAGLDLVPDSIVEPRRAEYEAYFEAHLLALGRELFRSPLVESSRLAIARAIDFSLSAGESERQNPLSSHADKDRDCLFKALYVPNIVTGLSVATELGLAAHGLEPSAPQLEPEELTMLHYLRLGVYPLHFAKLFSERKATTYARRDALLAKLGVHTLTQAIRAGYAYGIFTPPQPERYLRPGARKVMHTGAHVLGELAQEPLPPRGLEVVRAVSLGVRQEEIRKAMRIPLEQISVVLGEVMRRLYATTDSQLTDVGINLGLIPISARLPENVPDFSNQADQLALLGELRQGMLVETIAARRQVAPNTINKKLSRFYRLIVAQDAAHAVRRLYELGVWQAVPNPAAFTYATIADTRRYRRAKEPDLQKYQVVPLLPHTHSHTGGRHAAKQ